MKLDNISQPIIELTLNNAGINIDYVQKNITHSFSSHRNQYQLRGAKNITTLGANLIKQLAQVLLY